MPVSAHADVARPDVPSAVGMQRRAGPRPACLRSRPDTRSRAVGTGQAVPRRTRGGAAQPSRGRTPGMALWREAAKRRRTAGSRTRWETQAFSAAASS